MFLKTGYVYHIKDEKLMKNHENGNTRPTYFCIKNENSKILWFVPMSSKVEKYIDHIDTVRSEAIAVVKGTQNEITHKVNKIFRLKSKRNKFNFSRRR